MGIISKYRRLLFIQNSQYVFVPSCEEMGYGKITELVAYGVFVELFFYSRVYVCVLTDYLRVNLVSHTKFGLNTLAPGAFALQP